jgi:hypothetical protein
MKVLDGDGPCDCQPRTIKVQLYRTDVEELTAWWVETAKNDIAQSVHKIIEYGGDGPAVDLLETGRDLARLRGDKDKMSDAALIELAILFYMSSKINRWLATAVDGRVPSDDTLFDIGFYAMMARRNRAVGGWPVAAEDG